MNATLRRCGSCGANVDPAEPDPCLGFIPGVSRACCGHGDDGRPYVVLGGDPAVPWDRSEQALTLRGEQALRFFGLIRDARDRPCWPADVREAL